MISATVLAAVMFEICALRPNWRSPPGVCVSVWGIRHLLYQRRVTTHTHNNHRRLHLESTYLKYLYSERGDVKLGTRGVYVALARGSFSPKKQCPAARAVGASNESSKTFSVPSSCDLDPSRQGHLLHERPVWAKRTNLRTNPFAVLANCAKPAFARVSLRLVLPLPETPASHGTSAKLTRSALSPQTIVPSTSHLLPSHVVAPSLCAKSFHFGVLSPLPHHPSPLPASSITTTITPLSRASTLPSLLVI